MSLEDINKPTVISITNGYGTYSVSANRSDLSLDETTELIKRLLVASGYHPDNVNQYFGEE